MSALNVANDIL